MVNYWVLGLIVAVVAAVYLVRRIRRAAASLESVDLPLLDTDQYGPLDPKAVAEAEDDTAPSVLSPPEWTPPKSSRGGPGP